MLKDEIEKYEKLGYQCEKFSFENREGVVVFPFVARKENPGYGDQNFWSF